ncbi:MAG TPA: S8/S53 family peptidase [Actinomycetales bacterium]|nr:S8/S53 family peptidase [Actinomycetales bacterium]
MTTRDRERTMTGAGTGSTGGAVVAGRGQPYRDDQLVVGRPYARLVEAQLEAWDARPELEEDPRLNLALVSLDARAARSWLQDRDPELVAAARAAADEAGYEPSDVDVTLRCLRRVLADRYAGWVPTMGKNRVMSRLTGSYVIDGGGGDGRPQPLQSYVIDGGGVGRPNRPWPPEGSTLLGLRADAPGRGARVGLVDTRMATHPWLAGGYIAAAAALLPARGRVRLPWMADHATFVAGLVLRQAPGAVIELRSGLDDDGSQDSWTLAQAVADLADSSTDVVNLSLGCRTEDGQPPLVLSAAIAALGRRTLVVAAAGNHGGTEGGTAPAPSWPAALDDVIAVGALDGGERAAFSPDAPWVDAMAPGVDVVSTCEPQDTGGTVLARWSGTSFAAAAVSGAIAAQVHQGRTAREAWAELSKGSRHDEDGRPQVALGRLAGWPADGRRHGSPR